MFDYPDHFESHLSDDGCPLDAHGRRMGFGEIVDQLIRDGQSTPVVPDFDAED